MVAAIVSAVAVAGAPSFRGCSSFTGADPAGVVRPRRLTIACGDGNFYVDSLAWTRWGSVSRARGTAHENDCEPYCAAGHFHAYPVTIRLDRVRACGPRGRRELTRVTWTFPAARPKGARSGSETFRCA